MADPALAGNTVFERKDRVEAAQDVDGVPAGTPGTIVSVTGLSWIRYRVRFDNGLERNLVDARYLRPASRKAQA
jgi:hypothetical protein